MAEQFTSNFGFSYYDQYDLNWHTGMNNNFLNLDDYLYKLGTGPNFIPHSLWQTDSDADGIPDLWTKVVDSCTVNTVLATSEVYGFADKIQLTISNSSGSTKYPEFKISAQIPPNRELVLSAWLKSVDLAVQLRLYDGASNFDSTAQVEATVIRREKTATIAISATTVDLIVRVTVPDGTVTKLVEVHMPMLGVGPLASAFCPSYGEVAQTLKDVNPSVVDNFVSFSDIVGGQKDSGSAAADFALAAEGVTNGDTHDHSGGDGAQIDHTTVSNIGTNTHAQLDTHLAAIAPHTGHTVKATLTTKGDLYAASAASTPARVGVGTNGQRLEADSGEASGIKWVAAQVDAHWLVAGVLATGVEQGGAWLAPRALTIEKAYIYCKTTGTVSGVTTVDINKNGTTIYTTQGNRPSLAYDDGDKKAVTLAPDVTTIAEGDIITIDIDVIPGGADSADLAIVLICN